MPDKATELVDPDAFASRLGELLGLLGPRNPKECGYKAAEGLDRLATAGRPDLAARVMRDFLDAMAATDDDETRNWALDWVFMRARRHLPPEELAPAYARRAAWQRESGEAEAAAESLADQASALAALGRLEEAAEALREAVACVRRGPPAERARYLGKLASSLALVEAADEAVEVLSERVALLGEARLLEEHAGALGDLAELRERQGDLAASPTSSPPASTSGASPTSCPISSRGSTRSVRRPRRRGR